MIIRYLQYHKKLYSYFGFKKILFEQKILFFKDIKAKTKKHLIHIERNILCIDYLYEKITRKLRYNFWSGK